MSAHRARKLVEAGVWLRISGDHEGARRLFEQAVKLDPSNVRAKQLLEAPPPGPLPPQPSSGQTPPHGSPSSRNPFIRSEAPSRSVGLDVDWGLAAILPESQAPLRPPMQSDAPPDPPSAWDAKPMASSGLRVPPIQPGAGPAMEMVSTDLPSASPPAPEADSGLPLQARDTEVQSLLEAAQDLIGLDDLSGAMELILKAQRIAPDRPEVRPLRERTEAKLLTMLESKLGRLDAVPRVLLKQDEVIWLNLDHRAGFVLAQIDGMLTLEDVFAVSGMSRLDTARILAQLKEQGVISL